MPSTAEEIRKRARTIVKLPSGLEVEIRKAHLWDFMGLGELPVASGKTGAKDGEDKPTSSQSLEEIEEARRYSIRAIVKAAVRPQFTDKENADPSLICVQDLDDNDFQALAEGILTWMKPKKDEAETGGADNG